MYRRRAAQRRSHYGAVRDKLRRWLAFTDRSGTFYEYNCPKYTAMAIERLAELAALSNDEQTRTIARVFAVRAGLSALLHGHLDTGRTCN